ncbi:hypothetical protein JCM3774_001412 [Rhodotorula dairenensis]
MNSLEPVPDASPGRDGASLETAWFLSSTPTSPPPEAASSPPLDKHAHPRLGLVGAAPLWLDVEPLRADDPRPPPRGTLATPPAQSYSDSQTAPLAEEAPCMRSLSITSGRRRPSMTTERTVASEEAAAVSPEISHADRDEDDMREVTPPPFAFDPYEQGSNGATESLDLAIGNPPTPPLGPFSTLVPIQRTFRSRYASSSTDSLPLPDPDRSPVTSGSPKMIRTSSLGHKRSHSHVTPSTGYTPPASYADLEDVGMHSPPSPSSSSLPPMPKLSSVEPRADLPDASLGRTGARWRRSFSYEAQRAEPTTSLSTASATVHPPSTGTSTSTRHGSYAGVLRRRTRQPSGSSEHDDGFAVAAAATERGSSKRRRSGSLFASPRSPDRRSLDPGAADVPLWAPHSASRQVAAPVLARFDAETVTQTTTTDDDVRTIRRRTRLSFGCLGSAVERDVAPVAEAPLAAPAVTAAEHRLLDSIRLRPAPPIASRDVLDRQSDLIEAHAHRSTALSVRGEDLLREAAGVLRRAEDSVTRASNLVQSQAWESRLPSVEGLPAPGQPDTRRPVVGVRLGQGWSSSSDSPSQPAPVSPTSPPPAARRRRSSFFGLSTPSLPSSSASLVSPAHSASREVVAENVESSSAASTSAASTRARQFLTSLRARRPRLSRNATAVSPPEREDQQLSQQDTDSASYLRSWTLPSPPLAISSFDEEAETVAAAQLNEHLLERRRVSDHLEAGLSPPAPPPRSTLWGEPRESHSSQEQTGSRRLRGPTERANERWRRGEPPLSMAGDRAGPAPPAYPQRPFPSWGTGHTESLQTRRTPSLAAALDSPPRMVNLADTGEGDAFMRRREESPSPRGRRRVGRASSELFPTHSLNAAEEGISAAAANRLDEEHDRATFRLPFSSRTGAAALRPSSRVRFEDAEEAAPLSSQTRGWTAPSTGPLMLSSGSDGRRMIFPHPANAAGPSVAPTGTTDRGMYVDDDVETRRFFEEDDLHQQPFTFDRLARRAPEDRVPAPRLPPRRYPWELDSVAADAGRSESRPARVRDHDANVDHGTGAEDGSLPTTAARLARYGLADLFAHAEAHRQPPTQVSSDAEMRQRRPMVPGRSGLADLVRHARSAEEAADEEANALLEDRLAQHRQHRVQRLHALRHERNLMRSLLSGTPSGGGPNSLAAAAGARQQGERGGTDSMSARRDGGGLAAATDQPRSPGALWRRRGLGEFLRGFGAAGGGRGLISLFDDDLPSFWGRDSAALDPRNYLDDDEFDSSYEALIRLSEQLGDARPRGVSAEKLASLAKFPYSAWPMPVRASQTSASSLSSEPMASTSSLPLEQVPPTLARKGLEKEERCGICLCDYADDDECMLGHCGHGFHEECFASWLTEKGTCPMQRDLSFNRRVIDPEPDCSSPPTDSLSAAMKRSRQALTPVTSRSLVSLAARPRLPALPASASGNTTRNEVGQNSGAMPYAGARGALLRPDGGRRSLFGVGEIIGVLTNPTEVLRNLTESKKMLEEARRELKEAQERAQIPTSHTFSPLPGFFDRPAEIKVLERSLGSVPGFTVLFGASSVGKTALLRQVLSDDKYHVVHFDLRIAGFADLASLYFSLSTQLESYFAAIPDKLGREWGWGEFEKESFAFKHDRLDVLKRLEKGGEVKTSDIAHLLELFQSALLSYWNFQPMTAAERRAKEAEKKGEKDEHASSKTKAKGKKPTKPPVTPAEATDPSRGRYKGGAVPQPEKEDKDLYEARSLGGSEAEEDGNDSAPPSAAGKRTANEGEEGEEEEEQPPPKKMPVFFLDEAHKLPALIQSTEAMKTFLDSQLVLTKQDRLCHIVHATSDPFHLHWLRQLNVMQHCNILSIGDCSKEEARRYFEEFLLPHVPDKLKDKISFETVYKVFGGKLAQTQDFVGEFVNSDGEISPRQSTHFLQAHALLNLHLIHSSPSKPGDEESSSQGFAIYSSLRAASPHASPSPFGESDAAEFKASDLLSVMQHLQPGAKDSMLYFPLCRKLGAQAVDGMIRGRLLELRWTEAITEEGETSREERLARREAVGPRVLPTTPVVRYAMGEVLEEYRREGYTLPDASDLVD